MPCILIFCMFSTGAVYLDDCPAANTSAGGGRIPIWLIVFGCVSVVQTIIGSVKRCCKRKKDSDDDSQSRNYAERGGNGFESLISLFLFVWIIVGSVWVFSFYGRFNDCRDNFSGDPFCCHPVPYLFSFSVLIVVYVVSFLACFCCCCVFCLAALASTD